MKQLPTLILLIVALFPAYPADLIQDSTNTNLPRFYNGCIKLREALAATEQSEKPQLLKEAMQLLNTRTTFSQKGVNISELEAETIDASGLMTDNTPEFEFSYEWARAAYNDIAFTPTGLTRGRRTNCRVLNIRLLPKGRISLLDTNLSEESNAFIAISIPGRPISVAVTDGTTQPTRYEYNNEVAIANWDSQDKRQAVYSITNESDSIASIVLIAN